MIKWPEKKHGVQILVDKKGHHYCSQNKHFDLGYNCGRADAIKAYEESPKLVELDEVKLKKFVIECGYFSAVGVNYTTIVDIMVKAICNEFGTPKAGLDPKDIQVLKLTIKEIKLLASYFEDQWECVLHKNDCNPLINPSLIRDLQSILSKFTNSAKGELK